MNPELYNTAIHGSQDFSAKLKGVSDSTTDHEQLITSSQKNTILHIAAITGKLHIEEDDNHVLRFLYEQNKNGDTPLHIAAKLGNLGTTRILVAKAKKADVEQNRNLLSMVNHEKETALHLAVCHNRFEIVKLLIEEDKGLASIENAAGESPLFIAVDRCFFQVAFHILDSATNCSFAGRSGMNALHAAVIRSESWKVYSLRGAVLLRLWNICRRLGLGRRYSFRQPEKLRTGTWFALQARNFTVSWNKRIYYFAEYILKSFPNLSNNDKDIVQDLLKRFQAHSIMEKADDFGWIPLHYAACIGHKELVDLLLANSNVSLALTRNKQGMSALHISAERGRVDVIKLLIDKCPEICESLDDKDQTALHVAVEKKRKKVVKLLLESLAFQVVVNEKDKNGNTALHLAASMTKNGNSDILTMLAHDSNIDKWVLNKEGMTFVDILFLKKQLIGSELLEISSRLGRDISIARLEHYGTETKEANQSGTSGEKKKDEIQVEEKGGKAVDNNPIIIDEKIKQQQINHQQVNQARKDFANINLVIVTIIASASFAALFTMPGGYNEKGSLILKGRRDLKLFLLFDSLAFVLSATSMVIHFIAPAFGRCLTYPMIWILVLTLLSVVSMMLAFEQGVAVLFHDKSDQLIVNATRYGVSSTFVALISIFIGTAAVLQTTNKFQVVI